ncbi:MchS3 family protein [Serratia rubidaea]|uniref:MchS3 family protein n=1 Tax=Serratia rubidaea TaxID=61652 RepID=UPI0022B8F866|nr:MchS3 family protein [Serratia rubidaea]WBF44276.1 hypothetical protein OLD77_16695 [Serratia rubidaea]
MIHLPRLPLTATVLFTYSMFSHAESSHTQDVQAALEKVSYFSLGMSGFAGQQSEGERLYQTILHQDNSQDIFLSIANNNKSTPEAKLYAACGLNKLKEYQKEGLFNDLQNKKVSVLTGDILRSVTFSEIYLSILKHGCD